MLLLPPESSLIERSNPGADLLPSNLVNLFLTLLLEVGEERVVGTDAVDGVGQSVNVPIVDLDAVRQNFGTAGLFRDDGGRAALHGLEG